MKKLLILITVISLSYSGIAQNNKGKGRSHNSHKWESKSQKSKPGNSTKKENKSGVPAKVRAAFNRDHPNITDVIWSKGNGYWTAAFSNGIMRTSATYSANGQRINGPISRNARTSSDSGEGSIWDKILSKQ